MWLVGLTENSMFFLSWLTARGSGTGSVCLSTDTDSPVRMDWSTLSVVERMDVSLMSAGTLSPTGWWSERERGQRHVNLKFTLARFRQMGNTV